MIRRLLLALFTCTALSAPALAQPDPAPDPLGDVSGAEDATTETLDVIDAGPDLAAEDDGSSPAPAAAPIDPDDPASVAQALYGALEGGQWLAAIGLALVLAVWVVRRLLALLSPSWAESQAGGYVASFAAAGALTLGLALGTGAGLSWGLALVALSAAWAASGGFESAKDFARWAAGKVR